MTWSGKPFANVEAGRLSGEHVGLSFGENWAKYVRSLTPERLEHAERSLLESFRGNPLAGRTFVDVGCGSGLFSLCAARLGAASVLSVDVDPGSVACAAALRARFGIDPVRWTIRDGSILDRTFVRELPEFDRVYSWGALHHTGQMWDALENAMRVVAPEGLFLVALYTRPRWSALHLGAKRAYNRTPRPLRPAVAGGWAALHLTRLAVSGRSPLRYVREYARTSRGMSYWRDVEDWLGGLPVEFADVEGVRTFAEAHGFVLEHVVERAAGANNEYLLRRRV